MAALGNLKYSRWPHLSYRESLAYMWWFLVLAAILATILNISSCPKLPSGHPSDVKSAHTYGAESAKKHWRYTTFGFSSLLPDYPSSLFWPKKMTFFWAPSPLKKEPARTALPNAYIGVFCLHFFSNRGHFQGSSNLEASFIVPWMEGWGGRLAGICFYLVQLPNWTYPPNSKVVYLQCFIVYSAP